MAAVCFPKPRVRRETGFLDRAMLIGTPERPNLGFFRSLLSV